MNKIELDKEVDEAVARGELTEGAALWAKAKIIKPSSREAMHWAAGVFLKHASKRYMIEQEDV